MQDTFFYLTSHNGSHAVAMTEYDSTGTGTWQVWTSILAERLNYPDWTPAGCTRAFEYSDVGADWRHWQRSASWPSYCNSGNIACAYNCEPTLNAQYKVFAYGHPRPYQGTGYGPWANRYNGDLLNQSTIWATGPRKCIGERIW